MGFNTFMRENNTFVLTRFGSGRNVGGRSVFTLRPGQTRPGSLLDNVKNKSLIRVYSKNMTDDEKQLHDVFGSDLIDNSENASGVPDEQRDTTADVTITTQWIR
jgi:hypothetical protein